MAAASGITIDYSVKSLLGRGDTAEVFLVEDNETKNLYALKRYYSKLSRAVEVPTEALGAFFDEEDRPREALHEWRVAHELKHPNITQYFQFHFTKRAELLMERIDGQTLDTIPGSSLEPLAVINLVKETLQVLSYTFSQGWVSHDLHSGNFMVDKEHHIKVIDLASFELLSEDEEETYEEIANKITILLFSLVYNGHFLASQITMIEQMIKSTFSGIRWDCIKHNPISVESGVLFAEILRQIYEKIEMYQAEVIA